MSANLIVFHTCCCAFAGCCRLRANCCSSSWPIAAFSLRFDGATPPWALGRSGRRCRGSSSSAASHSCRSSCKGPGATPASTPPGVAWRMSLALAFYLFTRRRSVPSAYPIILITDAILLTMMPAGIRLTTAVAESVSCQGKRVLIYGARRRRVNRAR